MRFERGQKPKDSLNLGVVAQIKNDIIAVIPEIIQRYIFEFASSQVAGHIQNDIEAMTGHEVEVQFVYPATRLGDEYDMLITVDKPELKEKISIRAVFDDSINP